MGSSVSRRLVQEGAKVVLADLREDPALLADLNKDGEAIFVKTDVSSETDTLNLAKTAGGKFGRIDAVVGNAGLFTALPWDQLTLAEWQTRMRVNVDGVFLVTKAVEPIMTKNGGGKIINIGSDTVWMGTPGFAHYVASKAAVLGFTRAIASELGPRGITSVYVTPTLLDTPGTRASFPQGHFDYVLGHTPIGRFEKPEDVNGLIVFLCSDEAAFINGAAINIGGGISMH
jgi:NAD(P)-dependent dehydrogenase (short-subunit alcohol dehydrogenase family)